MTYQLEVAILPVSDLDRARSFYVDQFGFNLDVDYRPTSDFCVIQLTPPGSSCSIQLELVSAPVETPVVHYLVVPDVEATQRDLGERGIVVTDVRHKSPNETWSGGWAAGVDPERRTYATFADVTDPDGHRWVLQERGRS